VYTGVYSVYIGVYKGHVDVNNFDPGQGLIFPGIKTGSMLVYRPCDHTSGNLNKTSGKEKSTDVYLHI